MNEFFFLKYKFKLSLHVHNFRDSESTLIQIDKKSTIVPLSLFLSRRIEESWSRGRQKAKNLKGFIDQDERFPGYARYEKRLSLIIS